jgi:hypothetical protein
MLQFGYSMGYLFFSLQLAHAVQNNRDLRFTQNGPEVWEHEALL